MMDGSQRSTREFVTSLAWPGFPEAPRYPEIPEGWRQVHAATRGEFLQRTWGELLAGLDPHPAACAGLTIVREPAKHWRAGWLLHVPRWRPLSAMKRTGLASMNFLTAFANGFGSAASWLHSASLAFFQAPQFQTLVRSALQMGGLYLYLHTHPGTDPVSAAAADFADQVAGIGMILFGLLLSQVAHSGKGSPVSGTAAAPPAVPASPPPPTHAAPYVAATGNPKP